MFGLNVFEMCISIASLWLLIYVLCAVAQSVWAWIDDSEWSTVWISEKLNFSPWKYPVFNTGTGGVEEYAKTHKPFGYAKDKKNHNKSCHGLSEGVDYKYSHNICGSYWIIGFAVSLMPLFILIYTITLPIAVFVGVVYLSRFVLRMKKQFNKHIVDKNAHK